MTAPVQIDSSWIAANPAPVHGRATTKNSRGHVLVIGGSTMVPGAVRLTGEAALRAGAGKLQLATVESATAMLGLLVPEAAVIGLPVQDDGEIGPCVPALLKASVESADVVVIGPGISKPEAAAPLLRLVIALATEQTVLILDAAAIPCIRDHAKALAGFRGRLIASPHHGEMAALTGLDIEAVDADPDAIADDIARRYGVITVLKASDTVIATPDGDQLHYGGGGIGMATGGSGDVLAGAIAGIAARGAAPLVASGWGVWLHGQAGRRVATDRGPVGFLARELPEEFPRLLPQ
ncbi:NAD(P)H-hydrate dehydratase [Sphingomonas sp. PB2P19]|uniref:NAD(P)H-hydrate dehydratase n=1 Tax=Sphingomonas rhamnosi TaxID=3096156 RepID=UPI002FCCACE6